MARTDIQKKPEGIQIVDALPGETPPESLDKVRDILFGGQMRAVDSRLQGLEERLLREQEALRASFGKELADIDSHFKKEVHGLGEKLASERSKRAEDLKVLATELKDSLRRLEKHQVKLEETTGAADAELRDQILQHTQTVATEIERLSQRLSSELSRSVQELRKDKADITSLVSLFQEMASRLGGDSRAPAKNAPRG